MGPSGVILHHSCVESEYKPTTNVPNSENCLDFFSDCTYYIITIYNTMRIPIAPCTQHYIYYIATYTIIRLINEIAELARRKEELKTLAYTRVLKNAFLKTI